jgi:hypothetical protein
LTLPAYLAGLASNTATTPHTVILESLTIDTADTDPNGVWATINRIIQAAGKYVILDLSACTAVNNTIAGADLLTNNSFNIIKDNAYIKGVTLPSALISIGNSAFQGCSDLTSVIFGAGSNITTAWDNSTFFSGADLWNVYTSGSKPGTYTRDSGGTTWTQVQ